MFVQRELAEDLVDFEESPTFHRELAVAGRFADVDGSAGLMLPVPVFWGLSVVRCH